MRTSSAAHRGAVFCAVALPAGGVEAEVRATVQEEEVLGVLVAFEASDSVAGLHQDGVVVEDFEASGDFLEVELFLAHSDGART